MRFFLKSRSDSEGNYYFVFIEGEVMKSKNLLLFHLPDVPIPGRPLPVTLQDEKKIIKVNVLAGKYTRNHRKHTKTLE